MSIQVETKDCTTLGDAELAELADLCAQGPIPYEVGLLSKQAEAWVLITQARDNGKLKGFAFCTLERIGGTPCVLVGLASITRGSKRDTVLRNIVQDQLRRAVLAFPDEDVLIGTRFADASGFDAFTSFLKLQDVCPRPDHKPTGEDRAWGRRLAKRFGVDTDYDERAFIAKGDGNPPCVLDHESAKPEKISDDVRKLFADIDSANGDSLIAFAWAMAEDLAPLA
jgi:hypothetical protein